MFRSPQFSLPFSCLQLVAVCKKLNTIRQIVDAGDIRALTAQRPKFTEELPKNFVEMVETVIRKFVYVTSAMEHEMQTTVLNALKFCPGFYGFARPPLGVGHSISAISSCSSIRNDCQQQDGHSEDQLADGVQGGQQQESNFNQDGQKHGAHGCPRDDKRNCQQHGKPDDVLLEQGRHLSDVEQQTPQEGASGATLAPDQSVLSEKTAIECETTFCLEKPEPPKFADGKRYHCQVCGKGYTRNYFLGVHMRTHTGEKPYKCDECGERFNTKNKLTNHMRLHTGKKPFQCAKCGKGFTRKENLETHMGLHTGNKPFKCSLCGKGFTRRYYLDVHMRIHTGEKPFVCSTCGKRFTQSTTLSNHYRVHTGERPYQCSECQKCFTQQSSLNAHMRIHTGEKPYKCSVCGKFFAHSSSLKGHMRVHVKGKPNTCPNCGKAFPLKKLLLIHMQRCCREKELSEV